MRIRDEDSSDPGIRDGDSSDPGSGIRDGDSSDPGSGMEKSRIQDKHPGSATLSPTAYKIFARTRNLLFRQMKK